MLDNVLIRVKELLEEIETKLFNLTLSYRDEYITEVFDFKEFKKCN